MQEIFSFLERIHNANLIISVAAMFVTLRNLRMETDQMNSVGSGGDGG